MSDKTNKKSLNNKKQLNLKNQLKAGEQSGFVKNFDRKKFIQTLYDKYSREKTENYQN